MSDTSRLLFIHGLEGSGQGFKAQYLRRLFPDLLAPDFPGDFWQRMAKLREIVADTTGWTMIGSSMGGLMAAAFACAHPQQVKRLVLLAPALPYLDPQDPRLQPTSIPVTIFHGDRDDVVPLDKTRAVAEQLFSNLDFHVVEATHDLNPLLATIDWMALLGEA